MAQFSQLMITNKGQALIAKILEGASGISFTKACTSSAAYEFDTLQDLTSLSDIEQTTSALRISRTNDVTVTIEVSFTNTELTTGYFVRTVGLYAIDPDDGEILYAVSIEESASSCWMPPFNGITVSDIYLKFVTVVGNADSILIEVNPAINATVGDIEDLEEKISDLENTISITIKENIEDLEQLISALEAKTTSVEEKTTSGQVYDADTLDGYHGDYYRCENGCSWTCSATCTGGCTDSCTTTCGTSCSGTCTNTCTGACTGSCSGTCTGSCSSGCTGTCTSCSGTCLGTCTGDPSP